MDKALYIAMTGATHNMRSQTSHANNLANASTVGFKSDYVAARSMPIYGGDGLPSRAYALAERPRTDFTTGSLQQTGRELDIAVDGDGFIAVQAPNGDEVYTRAGSLYIDKLGILRTGNGLPVMGNGGNITILAADKIEIGIDGNITLIPSDDVTQPQTVDRIKLIEGEPDQMFKGEDGLFRFKDGRNPPAAEGAIRVASGYLEGSNVNAVNELTGILSLSRQYEMQVKLMSTAKEMSEAEARLLQLQM